MTSIKLRPCPFCGDRDPEITGERGWTWLACTAGTDCTTRGPERETEREAILAWNHRPEAESLRSLIGHMKKLLKSAMTFAPPGKTNWKSAARNRITEEV